MTSHRILWIAITSLVAAPLLAGCAEPNKPAAGEQMTLKIGTLMPLTGQLNNLGPGMQNGARMAIEDVNTANAGLQLDVVGHEDDKTTDTSAITGTFNLLASRGAEAIVGPCCSGVTGAILDLAKQEQIVVSSPSATSPALTEKDHGGYFWRVPPNDNGQGQRLAELVDAEGIHSVNIIAINNDYGSGLADVFTRVYTTSLSGVVVTTSKYAEGATEFSSQVTEACTGAGTAIQAIVLVGYTDDAASILKGMQAQDCLRKVRVFASEGVYSPDAAVVSKAGKDEADAWLANGMKGTTPNPPAAEFNAKFEQKWSSDPTTYSAESYDAVMYVALAALAAKSTEGSAIKEKLLIVANAPGEKCRGFKECADLLNEGQDIDYEGYAHDYRFTDKHEPDASGYVTWLVTADGSMTIAQ